jgi:HPt (histidine-containing phosphotransfer) domain-containing protein
MAGMRSLYVRTARDFVKILERAVPELQHSLVARNQAVACMRLHTLKGNAGTLGAGELAAAAARLESLCKSEGGMQACEQALPHFGHLVGATQTMLNTAIAGLALPALAPPQAKGAADEAAAYAALRKLSALAGESDLDALQVFAEERQTLSVLPEDFLDRLDLALQELDLAAAHALGEDLLAHWAA